MSASPQCGRLRVGKSSLEPGAHCWSELPRIRPSDAGHDVAAGHNALRGSGPGQKPALEAPWRNGLSRSVGRLAWVRYRFCASLQRRSRTSRVFRDPTPRAALGKVRSEPSSPGRSEPFLLASATAAIFTDRRSSVSPAGVAGVAQLLRSLDESQGLHDQELPQVAVPSFADASELRLAAGGVLLQGGGDQRPDDRNALEIAAQAAGAMPGERCPSGQRSHLASGSGTSIRRKWVGTRISLITNSSLCFRENFHTRYQDG
jgi:hypothetical protein